MTEQTQTEQTRTEEFNISGDQVVDKVKELLHEGNVRRLSFQTDAGNTLFEVPLTIGVVGAAAGVVFAPMLTAIGALAAVVARMKVKVERVDEQAEQAE